MINWLNNTYQSYFLHPTHRGENQDRRESICSVSLAVSAVATFFFGIEYWRVGDMAPAVLIMVGFLGICGAIAVHRFLANRFVAVNIAMISMFFVIILPSLIYGGGANAPGMLWIGNCIMAVSFLMNLSWTIFWGAAFILGIFALNFSRELSIETITTMAPQDYNHIVFLTSIMSTLTMLWFSYQYKNSRDDEKKTLMEYDRKLRAILDELSAAKEEVQKRLEQNINLVRVISHDIATPLQVIKLSQTRIPPESPARQRIEKATDALTTILDYVREYRAVLDGKRDMNMVPVNLAEVLKSTLALFDEVIEAKAIKLKLEVESPELKTLGDQKVLGGIIISNLISNSIKFTNNGGSIRIQQQEQNGYVVISIRDSGIGMPKALLENIFAIDKKTSRTGTNGEVGTGFGMPLVKAYVEMHRGTISINSWEKSEFPAIHGTLIEISFPKYIERAQAA